MLVAADNVFSTFCQLFYVCPENQTLQKTPEFLGFQVYRNLFISFF